MTIDHRMTTSFCKGCVRRVEGARHVSVAVRLSRKKKKGRKNLNATTDNRPDPYELEIVDVDFLKYAYNL